MSMPTGELPFTATLAEMRAMSDEFQRFLLEYRFGLQEVETKITILRDEFQLMHDYNPIEHVSSRVKTPDSLAEKVARRGIDPDFPNIRQHITDIAGIRVTCSFVADAYRLFDLLTAQDDIVVRSVKAINSMVKTVISDLFRVLVRCGIVFSYCKKSLNCAHAKTRFLPTVVAPACSTRLSVVQRLAWISSRGKTMPMM